MAFTAADVDGPATLCNVTSRDQSDCISTLICDLNWRTADALLYVGRAKYQKSELRNNCYIYASSLVYRQKA